MKIIQSCWSCNKESLLQNNAGWLSAEYHIMSWALSCLKLKAFYKDVTLHSDSVSAKILIDGLELPYTNVVCDLDQLNKFPAAFWALPKIQSYNQSTPFLHVDSDVYIWKPFDTILLDSGLIAQNEEESIDGNYEAIMSGFEKGLTYFPEEIIAQRKLKQPMRTFNAGILGGHDVDFFQRFSDRAFQFVERNLTDYSKINLEHFNVFFEQYLFFCMVKEENKIVHTLKKQLVPANGYYGFANFIDVPHKESYVHMSGDFKHTVQLCDQMSSRLRHEFPEYYYRIISLFKKYKIPILKDYFRFEGDFDPILLLKRHEILSKSASNLETRSVIQAPLPSLSILEFPGITSIQKTDFKEFINQLKITLEGFSHIPADELFKRDLDGVSTSETIFGCRENTYLKQVVRSNGVTIIESEFDWSRIIDRYNLGQPYQNVAELESSPSQVYTLVIPECDQYGYAIHNVDVLDYLILETLSFPLTIEKLLTEIKTSFNSDSVEQASQEFEKLIFTRLKLAFQYKSIIHPGSVFTPEMP